MRAIRFTPLPFFGITRVGECAKVSESTFDTFELFRKFPDAETARKYLESRSWPDGVKCPACRKRERIGIRNRGFYRCNACKLDFTVRTGTIFERSHVPLHKWLAAMYLLLTSHESVSSMQLGKEIGIRQASAWFLLHRVREAYGPYLAMLRGTVEVDDVYCDGKGSQKRMGKRMRGDRGLPSNSAAVGTPNFLQGFNRMKSLEALDQLVDVVLKYKPRKKRRKPR
jgi:transposase-like protein